MFNLIKWKARAIPKPRQPSDPGDQYDSEDLYSSPSPIEAIPERPTIKRRSKQQEPDAPPPLSAPSQPPLLSRSVSSVYTEIPLTPVPQAISAKGKARAQFDGDYDLTLALQLQEEGGRSAWSESFEDVDESDDHEYQPSPVIRRNPIPIQSETVVIRSRPIKLQPTPQAPPQHSEKSISVSESTAVVVPAEDWEAYDAEKWDAANGSVHPPLQYTVHRKECIVCADEKSINQFPRNAISDDCSHDPNTCLDCIETHIKTLLESKVFHDRVVACPECDASLTHDDIQRFADPATYESYTSRAANSTIDQIAGLFRCPVAKCNSGQIHDDGEEMPIVICIGCQKKYCFKHKIAWHETLTCVEYDRFLANPKGFKSRLELDNEQVERELAKERERQEHQEEASRVYILQLLEGEQREEARRQAESERRAREEEELREKAKQEEKIRRAEEARRKLEKEARQKQESEQANLRTIQQTTKNCPRCNWPIEKKGGCAHMTCIKCLHQFYWCCLASYTGSHGFFCLQR